MHQFIAFTVGTSLVPEGQNVFGLAHTDSEFKILLIKYLCVLGVPRGVFIFYFVLWCSVGVLLVHAQGTPNSVNSLGAPSPGHQSDWPRPNRKWIHPTYATNAPSRGFQKGAASCLNLGRQSHRKNAQKCTWLCKHRL